MQAISMEQKAIEIAQALTVVCELTNTVWNENAKAAVLEELLPFELGQVLKALKRCQKELMGRLTLAAILERIDSSMPNADEAWALAITALKSETETVVLPEIAMQALNVGVRELFQCDKVGARMAFKSAYERILSEATHTEKAKWTVSLGSDKEMAKRVLLQAVVDGKLEKNKALNLLPYGADNERAVIATGKPLTIEEKRQGTERIGNILKLLPKVALV